MTEQPAAAQALPNAEALALARRAAGAAAVAWPAEPQAVSGVGGLAVDLTERPGPERIAWATLNGKDGLLGLFAADGKLLAAVAKGLGQIERVQPVSLPGLPHLALMVDDRVDEMVGAFFKEERRHIYVWDGRRLKEVFAGPLLVEQIAHAQWRNKRAPAVWRLRRTEGDVILQGGRLVHTIREQRLEAPGSPQAPIPERRAFRLLAEEPQERRYRWNARLRRFDQAEA